MQSGVSASASLPGLEAVRAKVKVVANEALVALAREAALVTGITAHSCEGGGGEGGGGKERGGRVVVLSQDVLYTCTLIDPRGQYT